MKSKKKIALATAFGLLAGFHFFTGCSKNVGAPTTPAQKSGTAQTIDASNLELVSETEEKERDGFQTKVRTTALNGGFFELESQARDFRSNKTRFANGDWKLRKFYVAFGDYEKIGDETSCSNLIFKLEAWASQNPDSIVPRLALVEAYHGYAWLARSSRSASEVTERGEKLMEQRMEKGFVWLREAQKLQAKEKDPAFYAVTLHSFLGANVEQKAYENVFEAGIHNAPDYNALYEYKAYYLFPRWYGEPGEWEKYARKISGDGGIPHANELFARIALFLRDIGYFYQEFSGDDQSWEELKSSFHAVEANHPDSLEIKSILCLMSAKMCDYKEARTQAKLLNGKVDLSVWTSRTNFQEAISWLNQDDAALEECRRQFKAQQKQKRSN